ncbi:MAG: hypothetical protein JW915_19090 [Chitinispirillaceae bacterium]|nr:hypothetical protein [Chitinispirillaceae bacterium]
MKLYFFFGLLLLCFETGNSQLAFRNSAAASNDSTYSRGRNKTETSAKKTGSNTRLWGLIPFSRELLSAQRTLSGKLSSTLRAIKAKPGPVTVATLLFFAFLYGILHSLGPGHAKMLFISHGLSRASPFRTMWLAGALFSLTHAGSAIVLFIVFRKLLGLGQSHSDAFSQDMITMSGILIIVAGSMIFISSILEKKAQNTAGTILHRSSGIIPVAIVAGLAPCPGAFLILTFSSIIHLLPVGIAAVAAVSIGMAITVSFAGMAGSSLGKAVTGKGGDHHIWHRIGTLIRYLAALIIILVGLLMILG